MTLLLALAALGGTACWSQQTTEIQSPPQADDSVSKSAPEKLDADPYFHEVQRISSKTGPQLITREILQDSQGGFWLATFSGLVRYDGTTFTNVTHQLGLRRYRAFCLLEDQKKNIWVGTIGAGVYRYDGRKCHHGGWLGR
jgi:ligand-binding sensor domain-containing protein